MNINIHLHLIIQTEKLEKEEKKSTKSKKNKKISEEENIQVSTTSRADIDAKPVENSVQKKKNDAEKKVDNFDPKVEQAREKNTSASDESGGNKTLRNYCNLSVKATFINTFHHICLNRCKVAEEK